MKTIATRTDMHFYLLGENAVVGPIQRIVEVKDPGIDPAEVRQIAFRLVFAAHRVISVPAPWSVSNSTSTACGVLPSRMTTPSTPRSTA